LGFLLSTITGFGQWSLGLRIEVIRTHGGYSNRQVALKRKGELQQIIPEPRVISEIF
jgi:hypothetical protein